MNIIKRYILLSLAMVAAFSACKKDEGNYSYHSVDAAKVDTSTLATGYSVLQFDSLKIAPGILYKGDTANLSYQWLVYVKSLSSLTIGPPITLATTRNIAQPMNVAPGAYYLELIITDKTNSLVTTTRTLLTIQAAMEDGWLVLHDKNGASDVDFIASKNMQPNGPDKRLANLFQSTQGAAMPGNGRFVGFARRSSSAFNWITVGTDQGIRRMNGFTFAQLGADSKLFRRTTGLTDFGAYYANGSTEIVSIPGNMNTLQWAIVEDALFNAPYEGDFTLSPYVLYKDYPIYTLYAYDMKYSRFLRSSGANAIHAFTTFKPSPQLLFDPNNVGKDLLFMDYGYLHDVFAFFKDKTGNGRYLYQLNANKADDGNMAMATYDMSALPDILNAKFFQVGDLANVALYATDRTVYRFDYSGSQTANIVYDGLPAGETITSLKIFRPRVNGNSYSTDFNNTDNAVIYIATWDGTQGKLYEMAMNVASGAINPTPLKTYTGFGKIKDMAVKFRGTGT